MLLLNMVTPEELYDDQDYADILEDIQEECSKYGEIEGVRVPRPIAIPTIWMPQDEMYRVKEANRKKDDEAGVGRVYVLYKDIESTAKAMKAIGGRQFAGRTILVACVAEVSHLSTFTPEGS
jgi:splicing factor U2AF subunit